MSTHGLTLAFVAGIALASSCSESSEHAVAPDSAETTAVKSPTNEAPVAAPAIPITIDKGDGCTVVIQQLGHGRGACIGDELTLEYVARVSDSETPFASTATWNEPCRIELGAVQGPRFVSGLSRGLEGLKAGSKATITIPPALAYGKTGLPGAGIPADATLVFEIEVTGVR